MQLNLCPLFSGSSGNSVYMACGGVKLLVDAGMSAARVEANLREIGVDIRNIDAILVTHEHIDHVRGLGVLCRRYGMPVYANEGTWQGILQKEANHDVDMVRRGPYPQRLKQRILGQSGAPQQRGLRPRAVRAGGKRNARRLSFSPFY